METILLSCEHPPALKLFVEDENNIPLYTAIYSESIYELRISEQTLPLYVMVDHHDYSMDVAVC